MKTEPAKPLDTTARVALASAAVRHRKGFDLKVLHLEPVTEVTEYFVICSASNRRQVQAIAEAVRDELRAGERLRPLHVEGMRAAVWVLLDYGDFVVHVFDRDTRDFYDLERLWSDAPDVTTEFAG